MTMLCDTEHLAWPLLQNKAKSELRKALPDSAHCTHCKMVKASTEFYGDRSQSNGLKPHCK